MARVATIELCKESMKFSVGHFTIFSHGLRENLHGHNYQICASLTTSIEDEGLSFDYRFYKGKLQQLCDSLDEITLIPGLSKYLHITEQDPYYFIHFNEEKIIFLKRDVKILEVTNITVEELSNWFIEALLKEKKELEKNKIIKMKVKVSSGPGQSGYSTWEK